MTGVAVPFYKYYNESWMKQNLKAANDANDGYMHELASYIARINYSIYTSLDSIQLYVKLNDSYIHAHKNLDHNQLIIVASYSYTIHKSSSCRWNSRCNNVTSSITEMLPAWRSVF